MRVFTYHKSVLPSGLRVITEEVPHVRSVAVGIWLAVGSRHESEEFAGIAHFIEHMLFKGTETRSARQIAETMDAIGGHLNAFTGKEYTCFYAKVLDEHFPVAMDLLADIFLHPRLDPEDIEKERNVIIEEIMMYEDSPEELVHDIFAEAIWPGHPLGRAIQGGVESVQRIKAHDVQSFYRANYVPGNTVVAVSGNVTHEAVLEEVCRHFPGSAGGQGQPALHHDQVAAPQAAPRRVVREKDIEQVHVCLGGEGLSARDERFYELSLLTSILGGGSSSRLFQEIREQRGLAYSVYAYSNCYKDSGVSAIYLASGPGTVGKALELARKEVARMIKDGVTSEELRRCKDQVKASLLLGLENTASRMMHLGKGELIRGDIESPDEIIERVEGVTREDISALAAEIWDERRLGLAAVGPVSKSALGGAVDGAIDGTLSGAIGGTIGGV